MVKYQASRMDRTFSALADPTRRAVLLRLKEKPGLSVSELARPFSLKLPGMMKHLDVLSDAGLITRTKTGRTVSVNLSVRPMREAMDGSNGMKAFGRSASIGLLRWSKRMARDDQKPAERDHRAQDQGPARQDLGGDHGAQTDDAVVGSRCGADARAEADVRPGGRFSVVFRLLNGDEHNPTGIYQEVIPEKKLVFTWECAGNAGTGVAGHVSAGAD